MAGKVISIEIGATLTKVCYLDYKAANTKVYDSFVFETPEGTVEDGYIKNTEEFCETLAAKLAAAQIKEKRVIFTISSSKIANREAVLPLVSRDKIMSMVRANSSDYFPVDIKNYHISYTILEKIVTKEEKNMKMLLLAVPLDLLETYFDLARTMNLSILSIDYSGNSIFQIAKDLKKAETNVCIHINEKNTIISVLENGVLALQRTIAYGADSVIEAILSIDKYRYDEEFTKEKALDMLLNDQMINTVIPEAEDVAYAESDLSEEERERAEITESLRYMIGNITRVIDYYMTKSSGAKIDMIYLSGIGAEFKGLRELFSFEIGSTVKVISALTNVTYTQKDKLDTIPIMLVAIGAAKNPMGLMPDEFKTKKVKKVSMVVPTTVLVGGLAIALFLFLYGQLSVAMEKGSRDDLQQSLDDMQQYKEIQDNYTGSKTVYNDIYAMYMGTENRNENLVAFIEELEKKMPNSFIALNLNVTETGVSIGCEVADKTAAAEVLQQLRTFDSVSVITASGFAEEYETEAVEEETDDFGYPVETETMDEEELENLPKHVTFTVSCTYKPIVWEVVETTEAGGTTAAAE